MTFTSTLGSFWTLFAFMLITPLFAQNAPTYLDPNRPGETPQLFAPNIVNTDSVELNGVFNAAMTEFFFTRIVDGNFIIHH